MIKSILVSLLFTSILASNNPTITTTNTKIEHELLKRQATSTSNTVPTSTPTSAPSSSSTSPTKSTSISVPQTAAVGGLSITAPAQTAPVSYYKIESGNPVTFGWAFTGLYVTPASLTFQAHCSANGFTYPVGPATGIPGTATQLIWDPYLYQQQPNAINFAQASYTLRVFDERGYNAIATAGYFDGSNVAVNFAMYTPAAYTPLASGWTCIGCSWAASLSATLSHPLLVALPITVSLILIGGAGVFNI